MDYAAWKLKTNKSNILYLGKFKIAIPLWFSAVQLNTEDAGEYDDKWTQDVEAAASSKWKAC